MGPALRCRGRTYTPAVTRRETKGEEGRGLALILLSTVAYGIMPILAKVAYASGVRPVPLLAWRFLLASLLFTLLPSGPANPIPGRQRITLWAIGAVFVVNSLAYFKALETVPASTVALLLYTYPVIVTLLSGLLGWEALTPRGLGAAALAGAGCALTAGGALVGGPGVFFALLTAILYATYIMLGSRFAAQVPAQTAALHLTQVCALVCVPWAIAQGSVRLPSDIRAWGAVLGITVLSTVVALRAFLAGLARVGPARAAVLSSFEVVVTMALAVILLGERLGPRQWAGAALILGAVGLQNLGSRGRRGNAQGY
jgi:drug/metabolite transporter (DMT)-like permease